MKAVPDDDDDDDDDDNGDINDDQHGSTDTVTGSSTLQPVLINMCSSLPTRDQKDGSDLNKISNHVITTFQYVSP